MKVLTQYFIQSLNFDINEINFQALRESLILKT
jgi:hypothetical protein